MQTILLVDDEFGVTSVLAASLHDDRYRVVVAADGRKGLEQITRQRPDLVIADLMMPFMNGFEMCEAIRADEAVAEIPIILISALSQNAASRRFGGYTSYLRKPFGVTVLSRAVSDALFAAEAARPH